MNALRPWPRLICTTSPIGGGYPWLNASAWYGNSARSNGDSRVPLHMNQDFADLLQAFVDADVRFLVVGAYALAIHGRPRGTGHIDIWVDATPENARRVMAALATFGAPMSEISEADFVHVGVAYQMGVPPGRIDILTERTGVTFEDAWPERTSGVFAGLEVGVIGLAAFIRNKRATGRLKDLADVEGLG